ncbi:MAG: DUF4255 domain-containing protein [Candidatus Electrothrix sp. ATG2]|nr:DUF4255 domain-containing protein [Candidatus Electrothrix sp. ATG2]
MISHALTIVINELNRHLSANYQPASSELTGVTQTKLGNFSEGFSSGSGEDGILRNWIYLSVVNIQEEKTLKNLPHYSVNNTSLTTTYENPAVFINLLILMTATHKNYTAALSNLSRIIRFFQFNNVFTQDNVAPNSISDPTIDELDRLEAFKLIFDLYSPSLEEVNHLWGTLGGKQYPFVLYKLRMLDLQFKAVQGQGGVVEEVVTNFSHTTR